VAADGAVPVHYAVDDGNTADTETHRSTWDLLHRLAGRADFLYVADFKLCTRENMAHIAERGGRFLTVMPRTRKEDADLRAWIQTRTVDWVMVRHGSARDGRSDDYLMAEAPCLERILDQQWRGRQYISVSEVSHDRRLVLERCCANALA
jgi:hypothetical protein